MTDIAEARTEILAAMSSLQIALEYLDAEEAQSPTGDSGFEWSQRSIDRMAGIHPDLRRVFDRAIKMVPIDVTVLEGMRTYARQRELVASGASQTMNSRHLTGHALDVAPLDSNGQVSWDWPLYYQIEPAIKEAARIENVPIEWGGDWASFKDGPHWQLPWDRYPA